jgi:hypothetical protein
MISICQIESKKTCLFHAFILNSHIDSHSLVITTNDTRTHAPRSRKTHTHTDTHNQIHIIKTRRRLIIIHVSSSSYNPQYTFGFTDTHTHTLHLPLPSVSLSLTDRLTDVIVCLSLLTLFHSTLPLPPRANRRQHETQNVCLSDDVHRNHVR